MANESLSTSAKLVKTVWCSGVWVSVGLWFGLWVSEIPKMLQFKVKLTVAHGGLRLTDFGVRAR